MKQLTLLMAMAVSATLMANPFQKGDSAFSCQNYAQALSSYEQVLTALKNPVTKQEKQVYISSLVRASMASKLLGDHERTTEYKDLLHRAGLELFGASVCGLKCSYIQANSKSNAMDWEVYWACQTPDCGMVYYGNPPSVCKCGGSSFSPLPL
jgi:hypothetical protein